MDQLQRMVKQMLDKNAGGYGGSYCRIMDGAQCHFHFGMPFMTGVSPLSPFLVLQGHALTLGSA